MQGKEYKEQGKSELIEKCKIVDNAVIGSKQDNMLVKDATENWHHI